jgi:hypothetical protein
MLPMIQEMVEHGHDAIAPLLEAEVHAAALAADGVDVPIGGGRFATEPVTA